MDIFNVEQCDDIRGDVFNNGGWGIGCRGAFDEDPDDKRCAVSFIAAEMDVYVLIQITFSLPVFNYFVTLYFSVMLCFCDILNNINYKFLSVYPVFCSPTKVTDIYQMGGYWTLRPCLSEASSDGSEIDWSGDDEDMEQQLSTVKGPVRLVDYEMTDASDDD